MKQWCGETLGDLEPVYHLLTITITLPQSVTHVDYALKKPTKKRGALGKRWVEKGVRKRPERKYSKEKEPKKKL